MSMRFVLCVAMLVSSWFALPLSAQRTLHVERGSAELPATGYVAVAADRIADANLSVVLPLADPNSRGEAWLTFDAIYRDPQTAQQTPVHVRVPLSSTEFPYGEDRTCDLSDAAHPRLTFSAGLDEKNFVEYRGSDAPAHELRFSLNKYLCRVLAAPFRCGAKDVAFSDDLSRWSLASQTAITLSADAPATLRATPIKLATGSSFDIAQCAAIAPSGGICCVQGKTTEWHCGGSPTGTDWYQVSGECFHRETGGVCKE